MKTKGTILLVAISGVVFMAYFLFSDFLSSDESSDGSSVELATGSTPPPLSSEGKVGQPKHKSFRRMDSSDEAIPESNLAPHGTEESEKWDQEQAEAREQAPKQAEQDPQNEEAQEEDGDGKTLNEEQQASLEQFLGQLTRENWRQARAELLSAYQNGLLPRNRFVENPILEQSRRDRRQRACHGASAKIRPGILQSFGRMGKKEPAGSF